MQASSVPRAGKFPGLITREHEPLNLELPFPTLTDWLIPTNQFYVRSHFPIPKLAAEKWRLSIRGAVQQELTISYEELRQLPAQTVAVTLECAGNGRAASTQGQGLALGAGWGRQCGMDRRAAGDLTCASRGGD